MMDTAVMLHRKMSTLLRPHSLLVHTVVIVMTDGKAQRDICRWELDIELKTFTSLYRGLVQFISSVTALGCH